MTFLKLNNPMHLISMKCLYIACYIISIKLKLYINYTFYKFNGLQFNDFKQRGCSNKNGFLSEK